LFLILGWDYQTERVQAGVYLLCDTLLDPLSLLVCVFFVYISLGSLCLFIFYLYLSLTQLNCFVRLYILQFNVQFNNKTGRSQLKIINASQGYIHKYENLKTKLYNCNANIYFNQTCLKKINSKLCHN